MNVARRAALRLVTLTALTLNGTVSPAQTEEAPGSPGQSQDEPPPRPGRIGDAAPSIEGLHLGDTEDIVIAVLGTPDPAPPGLADPAADLRTLRYRGGALMIGVSKSDGVVKILLRKPEGGSLDGVRVGDRLGGWSGAGANPPPAPDRSGAIRWATGP